MNLTDEQKYAVDLALAGETMVIQAGAGSGKTTVLKAIAEAKPDKAGLYLAFNSAIKREAASKFPDTVDCRTIHSLGHEYMRDTNPWFLDRLANSERMKFGHIANYLGVDPLVVPHWSGSGSLRLSKGRLAGYVTAMVRKFCTSSDDRVKAKHLPRIEGLDKEGEWTVHNLVGNHLVGYAETAWADLTSESGRMPYDHGVYLKTYQLSNPLLDVDYVLLDEAQDLNGVMSRIIASQTDTQIIRVGDKNQQIYEWMGALNSLDNAAGRVAKLTGSFRFGPEIAEVANFVLGEMIGDDARIRGLGGPSTVRIVDRPDAVLARRNATAIRRAAFEIALGRKVHIEGGGREIQKFAYAAMDLMAGRFVSHPDLACFESWSEVVDYTDEDELGGDLASMVQLVVSIGAPEIVSTVKNAVTKRQADIVVSTAHKSKGLEFGKVALTGDMVGVTSFKPEFDRDRMTDEDCRLLYVAVTRAEDELDVSSLPPLAHL